MMLSEAEHQRGRDRPEAMDEVDRDARRMVEHAAFVVDAEAAPQHERVLARPCRGHSAFWQVGKSGQASAA